MTAIDRWMVALAGLAGVAGVVLAAVAAHVTGGTIVTTAAMFLLLHAVAALAAIALSHKAPAARAVLRIGVGLMLLGVTLFSGDLALRELAAVKLLWGTAPFGGTIMILGWLAIVAAAVHRDPPAI